MCGSRTFTDTEVVDRVLNGFWWPATGGYDTDGPLTIIEGGAKGADALAGSWAEAHETVDHEVYEADWKLHGRGAGPLRNQRMLDDGRPDLVVAFVDKPLESSRGTADMVRRARSHGVAAWVIEVRPDAT